MASKFQVIHGGKDLSASETGSDASLETHGESHLSHQDVHFIKEMRKKVATIPTQSEDECLDALVRFEGPDNVFSKHIESTIFTMDRRGLFSDQEKTKDGFVPIKLYVERLFKDRIENILKLNGG